MTVWEVNARTWTDTLSGAHMDDSPAPELVIGDSFARILTETTQSLVCVLDREGASCCSTRRASARPASRARRCSAATRATS